MQREKETVATDFHSSVITYGMAVIYNCEATTERKSLFGHAGMMGGEKTSKAIREQTLSIKRAQRCKKISVSPSSSSPRIHPPNCQCLMFNVFVHLLILAVGIIFT